MSAYDEVHFEQEVDLSQLSRAFTKAGYHIACIGRTAESLTNLGNEIKEAGGYVSHEIST